MSVVKLWLTRFFSCCRCFRGACSSIFLDNHAQMFYEYEAKKLLLNILDFYSLLSQNILDIYSNNEYL